MHHRIYKNWRRHSTKGVPGWMVFSWAVGKSMSDFYDGWATANVHVAMVPFGAYCSIQVNFISTFEYCGRTNRDQRT